VKISRTGAGLAAADSGFPRFFDEKGFGIIVAKTFPEKGLTVKTNSLEFANCLPNQKPTRKLYEEIQ
jgi:hypothetical protein